MSRHWVTEELGLGLCVVGYFVCVTLNLFLLWLPNCEVRLGLQFFYPVCLPCYLDGELWFRIGLALENSAVLVFSEAPCR